MLNPVPLPLAPKEPPNPGLYQPAGANNREDALIDKQLDRVVALHFARLLSPLLRARNPSRALLVVGCPGDGKTFSLSVIASRLGIDLLITAGADYSGALEGAPVEVLASAEKWMRWKSATTKRPIALLVDDIDASIAAENTDQERTGNTNLLVGKLQSICNSPDQFTDSVGNPIPLLWTANTTAHFRSPLIRHGRVRIHHHVLDWQTKVAIAERIFNPATPAHSRAVQDLVERYRNKPIAFFKDLHAELADDAIAQAIESNGFDLPAIEAAAERAQTLDPDALLAAASARAGDDPTPERSVPHV
jgi:SpoVK/Ycf46/Vps4 family AAA+-type ATPase